MAYVLSNEIHVDNSSNEIITNYSLNRNLEKLLNNDIALDQLKQYIYENKIISYIPHISYDRGAVVYFKQKSLVSENINLYILRNQVQGNKNIPKLEIVDGKFSFEKSGWENLNVYESLLENDISSYVYEKMNYYFNINHSSNRDLHRFGYLTKENADNKLLRRDVSNIDATRKEIMFPYNTIFLKDDNVIVKGYYRQWDCGLIEYDIIFKLGYTGERERIDDVMYDVVWCNNLSIEDSRFFMEGSESILSTQEISTHYVIKDNYVEKNKNDFVNCYSGKLNFEVPFIDTNYMIFQQNDLILTQSTISKNMDCNYNQLTFTNKNTNYITPLYILFNEDTSSWKRNLLVKNRFHVRFIGKWK